MRARLFISIVLLLFSATPAAAACPGSSCAYMPLITRPPAVAILGNHTMWTSIGGSLHVTGEVQNTSLDHVRFIGVSVNFFNASGSLLDTQRAVVWLDILPPGEKTCFDTAVFSPPAGIAYYEFEPISYQATTGRPANVSLLNVSGRHTSGDNYEIIGQARSNHTSRLDYVFPVATLYDAAGNVLDCGFSSINADYLDPGQVSAFDIGYFSRSSYANVASYHVQVDA